MSITYLASKISPNQYETPVEGYRICKNVPICRTGFQDYLGSELKRQPNYDPGWSLDDFSTYPVLRPLSEVTDPETVASFEGKSVTNEHPPEHIAPGSLLSCETERELGCGHAQNVRIGPALSNGDIPLIADLHIKDDFLIDQIDGGVRDVSCGYTYVLQRSSDGTLFQSRIRGNHIAIVPQGRAGADISIKDAAPGEPMPSPLRFFEGVPYHIGKARHETYCAQHTALDAAASPCSPSNFFAGVPYKEGKARYDAHLAAKGER